MLITHDTQTVRGSMVMGTRICSNPDCRKEYHIDTNGVDDGFCSFPCFEAVNCKFPEPVHFEELSLDIG